ncbi:hypothetical protein [Streptomyces sp. AD55]|uniref:hypothetical protein n=1 Tax=Streptomyces sp. AD55 TaxID=3242895 RepID=UPI00352787CC
MSCTNCCPPVILSTGIPSPPGPPVLSPDPCNAAEQGPEGLLVPRTELEPAEDTRPGPVGDDRSVVIDTVRTGGCPDTWTLGARLSAPTGFLNAEGSHQNLATAIGEDVPVPASEIVLPEAGVYHLDTDVRYALGTDTGGSGYLIAWLQDETTGQLLTSFTQLAAINSPAGPEHQGGTAHLMTEYLVTNGPRAIRLHLMAVETGGALSVAEAGGSDSNGATRMRFLKVRD